MPLLPSILLAIYASVASFANTLPSLHHMPISTRDSPSPYRAGVNITVFNDTSCGHSPEHLETNFALYYSKMKPSNFIIQSYNLSRYLSSEEQLDFSNPYADGVVAPKPYAIPQRCGMFKETTSPDSNRHTLHDNTCYQMTGGATVRGHSSKLGTKLMKTDLFQPSA